MSCQENLGKKGEKNHGVEDELRFLIVGSTHFFLLWGRIFFYMGFLYN